MFTCRHLGVLQGWRPTYSTRRAFDTKDPYILKANIFTIQSGSPQDNPNHEKGLPTAAWKWSDSWHWVPDAGGGVVSEDPDGWVYAFNWPQNKSDFSPKMGLQDWVRRRRWERTRQLKSASELAEYLFARGFDEQVILTCYQRYLMPNGLINLQKV